MQNINIFKIGLVNELEKVPIHDLVIELVIESRSNQ